MRKILMTIYSIKDITPSFRNNFIILLDGDVDHDSYIKRFCKAIGVYDHNYHGDYIPESSTLYNQYFFNKPNEIITIIAPDIEYKYLIGGKLIDSYQTINLLLKFQSYLYSQFRNEIYIEFKFNDEDIPRKYYLAAHFLYTANGGYDTEISLSCPLSKKENKWLMDILSKHFETKFSISCDFCYTCYENNPKYPFHTEIHTEKYDTYWEDEYIKQGWYIPSFFIPRLKEKTKMLNKVQHNIHHRKREY